MAISVEVAHRLRRPPTALPNAATIEQGKKNEINASHPLLNYYSTTNTAPFSRNAQIDRFHTFKRYLKSSATTTSPLLIKQPAWHYRSPTYLKTLKVIQCWGPPLIVIRADREVAYRVRKLREELDEIEMADAEQLFNDRSRDNSRWLMNRQYLLFE